MDLNRLTFAMNIAGWNAVIAGFLFTFSYSCFDFKRWLVVGRRSALKKNIIFSVMLLLLPTAACVGSTTSPTPSHFRPWIEEEISFTFGHNTLFGILTLPTTEGPYPAVVLISGSVSTSTGVRQGVSLSYHVNHARKMALNGFAVLRYDPPGVGQSAGESGFESLETRSEEAIAALHYLQSRSDIRSDQVGLWGVSQGGWVIAMAAAQYPQDVAFMISVSGAGVSVAEQQIYSILAQSEAAGMSEEDIRKAVLFGRMLIDWQLKNPCYREENEAEAQLLGDGPWTAFSALVYEPNEITTDEGLQLGIEILKSIQGESWAKFLYLKELYIPLLEGIPPEQVPALRERTGQNLLQDPKEYLTRVKSPVLAVFGEEDLLQPTEKSSALYERYLAEAGNENVKIVVIPDVGHSIAISNDGYWEVLSDWLDTLYSG
jgi:pimeloyl-ACP methyl ester carboxylesterase